MSDDNHGRGGDRLVRPAAGPPGDRLRWLQLTEDMGHTVAGQASAHPESWSPSGNSGAGARTANTAVVFKVRAITFGQNAKSGDWVLCRIVITRNGKPYEIVGTDPDSAVSFIEDEWDAWAAEHSPRYAKIVSGTNGGCSTRHAFSAVTCDSAGGTGTGYGTSLTVYTPATFASDSFKTNLGEDDVVEWIYDDQNVETIVSDCWQHCLRCRGTIAGQLKSTDDSKTVTITGNVVGNIAISSTHLAYNVHHKSGKAWNYAATLLVEIEWNYDAASGAGRWEICDVDQTGMGIIRGVLTSGTMSSGGSATATLRINTTDSGGSPISSLTGVTVYDDSTDPLIKSGNSVSGVPIRCYWDSVLDKIIILAARCP